MFELVTKENLHEYEEFCQSCPKGHFLQSRLWADVKDSWTWEAVIVRGPDNAVKAGLSVLIRKMPGLPYTLMYAARGPVCGVHDEDALAELTRGAAAIAKKHHAYALKLDPDVKSDDTQFIEIMKKLGYVHRPGSKNFDGVQPNYVFRLDVKDKTEDELLAAFHQKTRYNLRLSIRKGVEVRLCGKEMLPAFSAIMQETGARDGFIVRPLSYFEKMLDALGEHARLYMAFWQDKPIAGTIAIHYGNKVWYLYGASSNQYRNVMPNYQLQWEMIRWALDTKCDIYDFRGVSGDLTPENPLYGLYLFKKGFSGELVEFCGEFEMIYHPIINYAANTGISKLRALRHNLAVRRGHTHTPATEKKAENADK